jgi:hypothetical protein
MLIEIKSLKFSYFTPFSIYLYDHYRISCMRKLFYLGLLLLISLGGRAQDVVVYYQSTAGTQQTDTLYLYFQALGSQDQEVSSLTLSVCYTNGADLLAPQVDSKFANAWGTAFELCVEENEMASYGGVAYVKRAKYAITTTGQGITIPSITHSSGALMMKLPFRVSGTGYGLYHVESSLQNPVNEIGDQLGNPLDFVTWDASIPFPVEMLSFDGEPLADGSVQLNWATASELNNSHFELEKSLDGSFFTKLADVPGARYSREEQAYSYRDRTHMAPTTYYRLKQVDLNGSSRYSETLVLHLSELKGYAFRIFPNPSSDRLFLKAPFAPELKVQVEVHDLMGRQLLHRYWEAGQNQLEIATGAWTPGVYFVKIKDALGKVETHRIVKK